MNKPSKLLATAATAMILFSLPAFADETALSPFAAQFGASYTARSTDWTNASNIGSDTMAAEAAMLYRLDQNMNLQVDYAYHDHEFEDGYSYSTWHLGGGVFSRDAELMMGLTGQAGKTEGDSGNFVATHYLVGPVLESYQGNITLGAKANYSHLDYDGGPAMNSGQGSLYIKFYATSNLALTMNADYAEGKIQTYNWTTYGGFGEAEYAYGRASVFMRAQYANTSTGSYEVEDTQAVLGLRLYLNSDDTSILSLHRSTTINNTNSLLENSSFVGN